jgi:hypothetical protein
MREGSIQKNLKENRKGTNGILVKRLEKCNNLQTYSSK